MPYNIEEIKRFLHFLDPNSTYFCFSLIPRDGKGMVPGMGVFFAKAKDLDGEAYSELPEILNNNEGATLHVTVNETDDKGRKTANIKACRVLMVDLDQPLSRTDVKNVIHFYGVHMAVESSPGRFHFYWKVSPTITLEEWKIFELGLSHQLKADLQSSQITKTIRVPGVERLCKNGKPFTPEIKFLQADYPEMTREDVLQKFPWILESHHKALSELKKQHQALSELMRARANSEKLSERRAVKGGGRNNLLYFEVKRAVAMLRIDSQGKVLPRMTTTEAYLYGDGVNNCFTEPLPRIECERTVESALKNGGELYQKKLSDLQAAQGHISELLGEEEA